MLVLMASLLVACGSGPDREAAAAAATAWLQLAADDPSAACDTLAPDTAEALASESSPCTKSLEEADLRAGEVRRTHVYGKDARVEVGDSVVYLARFTDGWRVTAAGCTPSGEANKPDECEVEA